MNHRALRWTDERRATAIAVLAAVLHPEGLTAPQYPHADGRCAITGGHVYRGQDAPVVYGAYLFADLCSGQLWSPHEDGETAVAIERLDGELTIASLGEDAEGEILVVDYAGGAVYRLVQGRD